MEWINGAKGSYLFKLLFAKFDQKKKNVSRTFKYERQEYMN